MSRAVSAVHPQKGRVARFWKKVDRADLRRSRCWPWIGRVDKDGYGRTSWCGHEEGAHRIAFALSRGPIPADVLIMHSCDNPPCCRPSHLSLGTVAQNNADMHAKGRWKRRRSPEVSHAV